MTLLQLVIVLTCFIFLLFAVDAYQRGRVNGLHLLVFLGGTGAIGAFLLSPTTLDHFWRFFGLARGADLIVYLTIIALGYFYFELLHNITRQRSETTRLCTAYAIEQLHKEKWDTFKGKHGTGEKSDVGVLIRAYNEGKTIGWVIDSIVHAWYTTIVVANDGSKDSTKDIVQKKQKEYEHARIILLSHLINRWGWAANKTLYAFASTYGDDMQINRWVTFDADGQMMIEDMQTFGTFMSTGEYDVLLGSRFVQWWKAEDMPIVRGIILRWGKILTRLFNGIWVSDPHNGYRVWTNNAIKMINITSDGMLYANEVNDEIRRHELNFAEVPVHIKYTEYSLWKWQKNSNAFKILAELIYRKVFYK